MFKIFSVTGNCASSGIRIDVDEAYQGVQVSPKDKEACIEALKHWLCMPHDGKKCVFCLEIGYEKKGGEE